MSDTGWLCIRRWLLFACGFAVVVCLEQADARAAVPTAVSSRETILISPDLRVYIAAMLQSSPTFRHQYERILGASRLIITARIEPTLVHREFCARSMIRRYNSGLLIVSIEIGPGGRQAEWIAHEFEHVIEQLDGVRLPALVGRRASGIWYSSPNMIETTRATRAGRIVLEEMRRRKERSDNFVE